MARFDLKFLDCEDEKKHIKTNITRNSDVVSINGIDSNGFFEIWLDKSTAIKFAKTLRTEINKITESEVNNG